MFKTSCFIIFILVIIKPSFQQSLISSEADCYLMGSDTKITQVFLTISSLYSSTTEEGIVERPLEVNWIADAERGDSIEIYHQDPQNATLKPVLTIKPYDYPGGYYRTDIIIPIKFFNRSTLYMEECIGYWTIYRSAGVESGQNCLKIKPFWMEGLQNALEGMKVNEAMIPGSHDSGSFYIHKETVPLSKYMYAQEESVFNQLVYGIRYFDLRVGYYPKSPAKYYINHNFLRTNHSVKSVLKEVSLFLKMTKKEVVILDFHNFPIGFKNKNAHENLLALILKTFGPHLVAYNDGKIPTFGDLWKRGKRILVSYDDPKRQKYHKVLWPPLGRAWGNKQHPEDLKTYFEDTFSKPLPKGIWASMAELTPNARTIILHPERGLRVLADEINKNVTQWFRDFYWTKANIVATDFFLGNDIIDVAIRANSIKGICPQKLWSSMRV